MRLTAKELCDKLLHEYNILSLNWQIKFFLGVANIIAGQKDIAGDIIEEWLQGWLDKRNIDYLPSENTQMLPDFLSTLKIKQLICWKQKLLNGLFPQGLTLQKYYVKCKDKCG